MAASERQPEQSRPQASRTRTFGIEFLKEFTSALVVLPILWVVGRALHLEMDKLEFVAAPVILAWFAARGWKTEDTSWPWSLPIWRFLPKFLIATGIVVGLPLLLYSIVRGLGLLLKSHDLPYLTIGASVLAVAISSMLLWLAREEALASGLRWLGLSDATTGQKARFAFYWLVSLVLIVAAVRRDGPQFDRLCDSARKAGADMFGEVTTSLDGLLYSGCEIRSQGEGYAVTIGAVPADKDGRAKGIVHFRAILYPDGDSLHFEQVTGDPRRSGTR